MTKLTTDIINKSYYYMLTKSTMDEYLEAYPIKDEDTLGEFKEFWAELEKEMKETKLPKGHSWDIPSEW
jgi:hypothetical protein